MMMKQTAETQTSGTINGRARYLSFSGAGRQARPFAERGRTRGSRAPHSLRSVLGPDPEAFLRNQRQPDGE